MNKRGMSHVEVILAFVLFIGFLSFGLYFFNPLSNNRVLDSSLFYALDEVVTNTSSPLLTYGVSLNETAFQLAQNISFPLSRESVPGSGFFVVSSDGRPLQASYNTGTLLVSRNNSEFLYVRFGEFVPQSTSIPNAQALTAGVNYSLSSSDQATPLNEMKLRGLNHSYYASYDAVRENFNLPRRIDFSVEVHFNPTYSIVMNRSIPEGFDVVAKSERREIVLEDGRVVFADLLVKVW